MKQKSIGVRLAIIVIGVALIAAAAVAPAPAGMSPQALLALVIFLVAILFWVTEVMPIAISGWAMVGLLPLLGVMTPDAGHGQLPSTMPSSSICAVLRSLVSSGVRL